MSSELKSIHSLSIAAIVLYLFFVLPGMICGIIASIKAMSIERLKTIGIVSLILTLLTIIGGWVMMIVLCVKTGKNS